MTEQKLTTQQFEKLKSLIDSGDRAGYYLKYYEFTGSDQSLEMAQISSFSDLLGGTAEVANRIAALHPNYPKEGVITFSEKVAKAHFDAVENSLKVDGTGIFEDHEVVVIAKSVWVRFEIGTYFPGNGEYMKEKLFAGEFLAAFNDPFGIIVGGGIGAIGGLVHTITLGAYSGRSIYDFPEIGTKYEANHTPDFKVFYLKDKSSGKTVYVEQTNAQKVGNSFIIEGINEKQIADKFGISIESVVENIGANEDIQGRPTVTKTFTITPRENVMESDEPRISSDISILNNLATRIKELNTNQPEVNYHNQVINSFIKGNYFKFKGIKTDLLDQFQKWNDCFQVDEDNKVKAFNPFTFEKILLHNYPRIEWIEYIEEVDKHIESEVKSYYEHTNNYGSIDPGEFFHEKVLPYVDIRQSLFNELKKSNAFSKNEFFYKSGFSDLYLASNLGNRINSPSVFSNHHRSDHSILNQYHEARAHAHKNDISSHRGGISSMKFADGSEYHFRNTDRFDHGYGGFGRGRPIAIELSEKKRIEFVEYDRSNVYFDMDNDGYLENTSWVSNSDAILAYDFDNNKRINSTQEIVLTSWDPTAKTDSDALKNVFDSNKDGYFDEADKEFNKFYLWQDLNQDGIGQGKEIKSLTEAGIECIAMDFSKATDKFSQENHVSHKAPVIWSDGRITSAYDVAFIYDLNGLKVSLDKNTITTDYKQGNKDKIYRILDESNADEHILNNSDYKLILGSKNNDHIMLTNNIDSIVETGDGDDIVEIKKGNNWVKTGPGKDKIKTGAGHDVLFIDSEDEVDAGKGYDVAYVTDRKGINISLAKANIETIYSGEGSDKIDGSGFKPVRIYTGVGNDELIGSDEDDILNGGEGKDKVKAGKGNDEIYIDDQDNLEDIDAGEGEDTIHYQGHSNLVVDLDKMNAEKFRASFGNHVVKGSLSNEYTFYGGSGNWDISGGLLKNNFYEGRGNDIFRGGKGSNIYHFSQFSGHDTIYASGKNRGNFTDEIAVFADHEKLKATRKDNDLVMNLLDSSLTIKDWFLGDSHKVDKIYIRKFQEENIPIIIIEGSISETGNYYKFPDQASFIVYDVGRENTVFSGNKGIYIDLDEGDDIGIGGKGNDEMNGGPGFDIQFGQEGNDIISLGGGRGEDLSKLSDYVDGGPGNDTIILQGAGAKKVYGGEDSDKFIIEPTDIAENTVYLILDFDLVEKETIDFTQIKEIKTLEDLKISTKEITIPGSLRLTEASELVMNKENKVINGTSMCWYNKEEDGYFHCVYLSEVSENQVYESAESFIFS